MKWENYIKRTAVRRVVWIVVGLIVYAILSAFGVAQAHTVTICTANNMCTEGEAFLAASDQAEADAHCLAMANPAVRAVDVEAVRNPGFYQMFGMCVREDGSAATQRFSFHIYNFTGSCAALDGREYNRNISLHGPPPSFICQAGCEFIKTADPPGLFCSLVEDGPNAGYWCNSEYTPTGDTCLGGGDGTSPGDGAEPPPTDPDAPPKACGVDEVRLPSGQCAPRGQCPLGQYEEDGVCRPAGSCPAGQVKGPDGSCIPTSCPAGQAMGQDGTCKADTNDDGTPDEEEPGGDGTNTDGMEFSGGESCDVPPTCSGDAIMCGQARIQWRIDCNTRKNSTVSGGNSCAPGNAPVCTGSMCDSVDQVKMLQLWESNCALQRLSEGLGEGDGSGGDLSGVEDRLDRIGNFLDGDGDCMATEGGCGDGDGDHFIDGDGVEESDWSSGLPSSGSCPAPISRTISLGQHVQDIEFSFQPLCDFAALLRWVLITAATILSAMLIGGFRSNA